MPKTMNALVVSGPGTVALQQVPLEPPGAGEIQVRTTLVGVCGTDGHLLHGDSFYLENAFQTYPFIFGHEYCGIVSEVGAGVTTLAVGDRVCGHTMVPCQRCDNCQRGRAHLCRRLKEVGLRFIPGSAAEFVTVPDFAVSLLPDTISDEAAVLVEPGVAAYHACVRLDLVPHDRVAVFGTGTLGLLALLFAKLSAHRVDVISRSDSRRDFALELGADNVFRPEDVVGGRYSAVIEASGSPTAFGAALDAADLGARLALIGIPSGLSQVDQSVITLKDLTIHGVLHGLAYYDAVVQLFAAGVVDPTPLIAGVTPAREAIAMLEGLSGTRSDRGAPKSLLSFAPTVR